MSKIHCCLLRPKLSPLLDGEGRMPARSKIEQHLRACESCRSFYRSLEIAREAVRALPRLKPREGFSVSRQVQPGMARQRLGSVVNWKATSWALGLVVLLTLAWFARLALRQGTSSPGLVTQVYAFDVGMYLDGVSSHNPAELDRFAKLYESRPVSLERAQKHVSFRIDAPSDLPGGLSFAGAYLLKGGCCYGVRLRYVRPGTEVDIFQQPRGHPVSFGSKRKVVPACLPQCQRVHSDGYGAYYWVTTDKAMVVVTALPEREVVPLIRAFEAGTKGPTIERGKRKERR